MTKRRKARDVETLTVAEAQVHVVQARHRSRLLIEVWKVLGRYTSENGEAPELKLNVDGDDVVADRHVVEQLRGEILVAATLANRRGRELMNERLANAIDLSEEPVFGNVEGTSYL